LSAALHNMERNILNVTYKDRETNKWMRDRTKVKDIMEIIKNRRWTGAGHISRRTDNRWSAAMTVWTPMDGKRNRRQRKSWRDEYGQIPIGQMLTNKVGDWKNANQEKLNKRRKTKLIKRIIFIYLQMRLIMHYVTKIFNKQVYDLFLGASLRERNNDV